MTDDAQPRDPRLWARILDTVGDAVVSIDGAQTIRLVNVEAERLFGWSRSELLGAPVTQLMPEDYRDRHARGFSERLATPGTMPLRTLEVEGQHKSGHRFPIQVRFTRLDDDGQVMFTAAIRDVSEQVRARGELERQAAEIAQLRDALELERDYLREEVREARAFGPIVGRSAALQRTLAQVEAVAATGATVLIQGESGVGKELIAAAIHERSPRANKQLIRVNCAAVPKELFESEFFGHRRGAFTGAVKDRVGRFELADGGTLFLDEVGEIPLDLQSKLLRVLQEGSFERLGGERTRKVDVRVVAATNRDLRVECAAGRFREDLYYRLSVFPLAVPPLRERPEDIVPLAEHFLERFAIQRSGTPPRLSKGDAAQLLRYPWPGNIRELQNVLERASILARKGRLILWLDGGGAPSSVSRPAEQERADATRRALADHNGVVAQAARALGISRQALYRRMARLGLKVERRTTPR